VPDRLITGEVFPEQPVSEPTRLLVEEIVERSRGPRRP